MRDELYSNYTKEELTDDITSMAKGSGTNIRNYKIDKIGLTTIDNRDCGFYIWSGEYSTLDKQFLYKQINYCLVYKGYIYTLAAGAPLTKFDHLYSQTFLPCLRTFVLETWNEKQK